MDMRSVDLKALIERDTVLKKVASTGGGEWHGMCPVCGGHDRFVVQPNDKGWMCRQCQPKWRDAAGYVMWKDGVGFKKAAELLGLKLDDWKPNKPASHNHEPLAPALDKTYIALNDPDWQKAADTFSYDCQEKLWSTDGTRAMDYLLKRGLTKPIIEAAGLGFNPADINTQWGLTDVWLPKGITIPWRIQGKYWRVNIRRPAGEPKYIGPTGGANGLYNADAIEAGSMVVMTEGEFDSLIIRAYCTHPALVAVATGTVAWARVFRWVTLLKLADKVILAFDVDGNGAGDKAAAWWSEQLGHKAVRLAPTAHDVTDMHLAGHSISEWLAPQLPELIEF
jgi:DNA primase